MTEYRDRSDMPFIARTISSFMHMVSLRKVMTEDQKDEMYKLIRIHGFNEGFQKYLFAFDIDTRKAKEEKDKLNYNYSIGRFPQPSKEPEYIEPNYRPSITEIRTFPEKHRQEQFGCTLVLYKRMKGWHIVVVDSPNLDRPKVFMSCKEKSGHVFEQAVSFFVDTYRLQKPQNSDLEVESEPRREEPKINSNKRFDFFDKDCKNK